MHGLTGIKVETFRLVPGLIILLGGGTEGTRPLRISQNTLGGLASLSLCYQKNPLPSMSFIGTPIVIISACKYGGTNESLESGFEMASY